jgi:hypothetical protein
MVFRNRLSAIGITAETILGLIDQAKDKYQRESWKRKVESEPVEDRSLTMAVEVHKMLSKFTRDVPTFGEIETDIEGATLEQVYEGFTAVGRKMDQKPVADVIEEGVYNIFQEALKTQSRHHSGTG